MGLLIGNYFSGLMPLFGLSECRQESGIRRPSGGLPPQDETLAKGGQLIFTQAEREDSSSLIQRGRRRPEGVTAALSLAPHLNLNSIL